MERERKGYTCSSLNQWFNDIAMDLCIRGERTREGIGLEVGEGKTINKAAAPGPGFS